jgi:hypothetical protein
VGELEDSGELTEAAAMQHPRRNEVYRDVGSAEHAPDDLDFIEVLSFPFADHSALLLCSDGLSDAVSSEEILSIVERHAGDGQATVQTLIAAATQVGHDNVSVVWVEGSQFAAALAPRSGQGKNLARASYAVQPEGERPAARHIRVSWYRRGPAYMLYGVLLGGALAAAVTFCIQTFVLSEQGSQSVHVHTVSAPESIAESLQKARPGDTVTVAPGTYSETLVLQEGITLAAQRVGETTIQGTVTANGLKYARLEGFSIQANEFGVRINDSDVVLSRDDIAGSHKAGVEFNGNSRGAIFACAIHNNFGPGIALNDHSSTAVVNNVIMQNGVQPDRLRPGLLVRSSGSPVIAGNIFSGNGAEAVWLPAPEETILQRNAFSLSGSIVDVRSKIRIVPLQEDRP